MNQLDFTPKGILNIGSTCYFNTAIQCLFSPFVFLSIFNFDLNSNQKTINSVWFKEFQSQWDIKLIYQLFTESKYKEFNSLFKIGQINSSFDCLSKLIELLSEENKDIITLFNLKKHIIYRCNCNNCSISNTEDISISFNIDKNKYIQLSQQNKLQKYILINSEILNDLKCKNCQSEIIRNEGIKNLPRLLIIRFSDVSLSLSNDKNNNNNIMPIEFNEFKCTYIPIAFCYHSNGIAGLGGHYTCIVMRSKTLININQIYNLNNLDYYYINDNKQIYEINTNNLIINQGLEYIIFQRWDFTNAED